MNATDAALALIWGLVAGSALLIGSAIGLYARLTRPVVAGIMAFGSGILISVIAFDLMDEAFERAGLLPGATGALLAMIADTMIPEAFAETHDAAGLIAALGFLAGFALSHGLA